MKCRRRSIALDAACFAVDPDHYARPVLAIPIPSELGDLTDRIVDALAPCIVLGPWHGEPSARAPLTRLGGKPLLAPRTRWPAGKNGPLGFVGQLDFGELALARGAALGLPAQGILALFYDFEAHADGTEPSHRGGFALSYCPDPDQAVALAASPGAPVAAAEPLIAVEALSVPSRHDARLFEWDPQPSLAPWYEAYGDFAERFSLSQGNFPPIAGLQQQVLGHADWQGRDARVIAELAAHGRGAPPSAGALSSLPPPAIASRLSSWKLLWQIRLQTDPTTWIDRGTLYVLIDEADLRACAFERAWVVLLG